MNDLQRKVCRSIGISILVVLAVVWGVSCWLFGHPRHWDYTETYPNGYVEHVANAAPAVVLSAVPLLAGLILIGVSSRPPNYCANCGKK